MARKVTKVTKGEGVKGNVAKLAAKRSQAQARNAKRQGKQHYDNPELDLAVAKVLATPIIPKGDKEDDNLRVATKRNAAARREWARVNGVRVERAKVCRKVEGDRPDNAVRSVILRYPDQTVAKRIKYVRAISSTIAAAFPDHPDHDAVYLYRIA